MSNQETSFEALAASPGDYAVDSEWMGDSPPALTVDFIQNPQNQIHHIRDIDRLQSHQSHTHHSFGHPVGGTRASKFGSGKDPLLSGDPTLTLSQPATVSSPESLLSSFHDSSSDISSKQTSMSALSSLVSGTPAKKGRGRPKGSGRSAVTESSRYSSGSAPLRSTQAEVKPPIEEGDSMMTDGMLDGGEIDNAQQNWSFRDYLRLDDDQDNDIDGNGNSNSTGLGDHPSAAQKDGPKTVDPKSIQRTPSLGGDDEGDAATARVRTGVVVGAGVGSDLSPYSGGPSPFDFVSASSSPNPDDFAVPSLSAPQIYSSVTAAAGSDLLSGSGKHTRKGHNKAASQYSLSQSMNNLKTASREVSPVSNFVFSQDPSPASFLHNSHSPVDNTDFRFGLFTASAAEPAQIASNFMFPESVPTSPTSTWQSNTLQQHQHQHQHQQILGNASSQMPLFSQVPSAVAPLLNAQQRPLRFFVGVTPHKSRVETQIPVTIFLSALPPGVTKLHLPPYTISKPKLLAKAPVEHSPDMLELHTMVVCTSAMQNEGNRRRALERAASATHAPASEKEGVNGDDGDDCRPANGGEIWICKGCIQRERKRANRKKSKKPEDDEEWSREEHRRIIIFNTNEIKDWQRPTSAALSSLDENASGSPIEAVISVPMRITCYCRHHGEKTGFQVIFTLKDFRGQVIAQTVSRSIMITDDHKTPAAPAGGSASAAGSVADGDASTGDAQDPAKVPSTTLAAGAKPTSKAAKPKLLSVSQSSPDLPALKRNSVTFSAPQHSERTTASAGTADTATSSTPRALSRPASPDGLRGHSSKKRKSSSGVPKVPSGLAMTRIETSPQQSVLQPAPAAGARSSSSASPVAHFSSSASTFLSPSSSFVPDTMAAAVDMALMTGGSGDPDIDSLAGIVPMNAEPLLTGPLTPNSHTDQGAVFSNGNRSGSFDNMALSQTPMFSAPTSAHPSRAPSPNGLRNSMQMFQQQLFQHQHQQQLQQHLSQAQFSQQFQAGLFSLPMAMPQAAATPTSQPVIHKIIPAEGPKSGGIEVTVLGGAFYQGLDVMFGDQRATTTTFWGESSLVCLVPPSSIAGHVPVTLRQPNQRTVQPFAANQQRIMFKYLDDDEQQLLRAALTVLSRKMTGKIEDAQDVARRIIGSETSSWGTSGNTSGSSTGNTRSVGGSSASLVAGGNTPSFETHLLKVLELIDLDDSSNQTRLNMQRRTTGHSMLHLACVLGMHRFVAGLLARGANPDVRDNGGYTPLHLAALNNQPEIVRRLIHAGADPTMRTLSGLTASEVAASREVLRAIKRFERHARSRSGGSLHSRTSSAASLRSLWEPMALSTMRRRGSGADAGAGETEDSADSSSHVEADSSSYAASCDEESSSEQEGDEEWLDMRQGARTVPRGSLSLRSRRGTREASPNPLGATSSAVPTAAAVGRAAEVPAALASPAAAAVSAFKEQLAAHFQQLVSQFPQMPNNPLPDYYQAYLNSAAFQRISSFVPNIGGSMGSRPSSAAGSPGAKELEGRWWDISSFMASSAPPPAYEEIFPHKGNLDTKQATAAVAAAEAEADSKCAALYDNQQVCVVEEDTQAQPVEEQRGEEEEPATTTPALLQIGRKHQITKEQQENFRRVHKEKRKGLRSDTFLYTVWIPILLGVLLLWLSGARAWDFFPSVPFNVPYATSLGNPAQPTGASDTDVNTRKDHLRDNPVLQAPPAVAATPNNVGTSGLHNIAGEGLDGIIA